jgi:hypothetical protein
MLAGAGDLTYVRVRNASFPVFPKRSPRRLPSSSSDRSWTIRTVSATLFSGRTRRIPPFGHLRHMIPIAGNGDLHSPPTHWSYATLGPAQRRGSRCRLPRRSGLRQLH